MKISAINYSLLANPEPASESAFFILTEAVKRYNQMMEEGVIFHHHTQASNKMVTDVIDYENGEQDSMKLSMLETLIADALMAGNMLPANFGSIEDEDYAKSLEETDNG